jgi:hypothetical protein
VLIPWNIGQEPRCVKYIIADEADKVRDGRASAALAAYLGVRWTAGRSSEGRGLTMERKALIRQYKESRRPMGVYRVRNTVNGKSLVGSGVELPGMLNSHRARLRLGVHENAALQRDWNASGPEAFAFEVLDTLSESTEPGCDPSADLQVLEALWLEKLSPFDEQGYNTRPKGAT